MSDSRPATPPESVEEINRLIENILETTFGNGTPHVANVAIRSLREAWDRIQQEINNPSDSRMPYGGTHIKKKGRPRGKRK